MDMVTEPVAYVVMYVVICLVIYMIVSNVCDSVPQDPPSSVQHPNWHCITFQMDVCAMISWLYNSCKRYKRALLPPKKTTTTRRLLLLVSDVYRWQGCWCVCSHFRLCFVMAS